VNLSEAGMIGRSLIDRISGIRRPNSKIKPKGKKTGIKENPYADM